MTTMTLSEISDRWSLELKGPDRDIEHLGTLNTRPSRPDRSLAYVTESRWLESATATPGRSLIVTPGLVDHLLDRHHSLLVTERDPEECFYEILCDTADEGRWPMLQSAIGADCDVASTAVIHDGVQIGDGCTVMDNVVVLPNTVIGDRVTIKPNSTIGGEGFQIRTVRGRRRIVPHVGGVELGDDTFIGSQTCIDRGLFGDFTTVARGAMIDNLVHVAHSVQIGPEASIVACTEISGGVVIGQGAWLGPNTSVNPQVSIGDYAYVGTASTVVRDVPPHTLAYGSPARPAGHVCTCRNRLSESAAPVCDRCGTAFQVAGGLVTRA
jgi:UDP-3-O-[3-hydroxymyristoyl] glucosamine N-acyltransferase